MIKNITETEIELEISSNPLVLLDFWAPWCGPCKKLAPTLEELDALDLGVTILKCNVDEYPDVAASFNVMSIPALFFFKDGKQVHQLNGARPLDNLESIIEQLRN